MSFCFCDLHMRILERSKFILHNFFPRVTVARALRASLLPSAIRARVSSPDPLLFLGGWVHSLCAQHAELGESICRINQLFGESVFKRSNWEDLLLGTSSGLLGLWGGTCSPDLCDSCPRMERRKCQSMKRDSESSVTSAANIFFESALRGAWESPVVLVGELGWLWGGSVWDRGWSCCWCQRSEM